MHLKPKISFCYLLIRIIREAAAKFSLRNQILYYDNYRIPVCRMSPESDCNFISDYT